MQHQLCRYLIWAHTQHVAIDRPDAWMPQEFAKSVARKSHADVQRDFPRGSLQERVQLCRKGLRPRLTGPQIQHQILQNGRAEEAEDGMHEGAGCSFERECFQMRERGARRETAEMRVTPSGYVDIKVFESFAGPQYLPQIFYRSPFRIEIRDLREWKIRFVEPAA